MSKRFVALLSGAALVIGLVVPVTAAGAQTPSPPAPGAAKVLAKSTTGSYVVVMAADPLVKSTARDQLDSPSSRARASTIADSHTSVLRDAGIATSDKIHDYSNALNGFSALLDYDQAVKVAADPAVALVVPDEMRHIQTDSSPGFLGLTQPGGAYDSGLTGEGVVVGVIDTGIWPEHPSFADDGTYPPPAEPLDSTTRSACDFGNTAADPNDAPFTCNNKLIGAREMLDTYRALVPLAPGEFDSARDDEGHGTHTASTSAGDAGVPAQIFGVDRGVVSGIAPRAQIIAYKALGVQGGFASDLAAAIDQAVADGVGVINYSVGGGANLLTGDTLAFLFAADAGVFVATSAGNDGPDPATIGGPADVPWVTAVGANTQSRFFSGTVQLAGRPKLKITGATVTLGSDQLPLVDAATAGGDLCLDGTLDPAQVTGKIVLCRRGGNGRADKSLAVLHAGGKGMILYNNSDDDNLFTDNFWVPTVHINFTDGLKVKTYIAVTADPAATLVPGPNTTSPSAPAMTIFSSRGPNPTASDIIKPDITAPGLQILAGNTPLSIDPASGPQGELFQAIAGTSMSSPHIAGVYALLKQAHPDWTAAEAKSAIMTTANTQVRDNDRVSPADPFAMGSGQVNPGVVAAPGSAFNPGLVYNAGFVDYLGFLCAEGPGIFVDPAATCPLIAGSGTPTDAVDLNYPSIGVAALAGTQVVTRKVTSVADAAVDWVPQITAPDGYSVTVEPAHLSLQPGQTASYTVTITNDSAPVGEWRFGDITWQGGGYAARSPIAVQGVSIAAPSAIAGTGTSGSAHFDVQFGYTGDYTAAPHGLVPETKTTGEISQDPDQTFPSPDDGDGVVKIPFPIKGAEYVRWQLVIPGDSDLDLYLLDSAGNLVASSTNGGTDERIDLVRPADDTYTMVIHGWQVPNPPMAFSLSSWIVPSDTGGSLVVDDAPSSAVSSSTGTVAVSWSGLDADQHYLGAVSHSDDKGPIGLTLVSVDT